MDVVNQCKSRGNSRQKQQGSIRLDSRAMEDSLYLCAPRIAAAIVSPPHSVGTLKVVFLCIRLQDVYMYMYTSTGFCTELQVPPIRSRDFDVTTLWYRADWWNAQQQIFLGIDPSFVSLRCFHLRGKHGGHYRKEKVLRRSDWLKSAPVIVNQEIFFLNKLKTKQNNITAHAQKKRRSGQNYPLLPYCVHSCHSASSERSILTFSTIPRSWLVLGTVNR